MNHQRGSVQGLTRYGKTRKYLLFSYLGIFRNRDNVVTFRLKKPQENGQDLCQYEVWDCQDLETGMREIKKFPVYMYSDNDDDQLEKDRTTYINDNHEVTSLLDSYDCWLDYCKIHNPADQKRDGVNFHIKLVNEKHMNQIFKLRELDSKEKDPQYKRGIRLKLIQKETPNHLTRRDFNLWKQEFPLLFTKLQTDVYQNSSNSINTSTNQ